MTRASGDRPLRVAFLMPGLGVVPRGAEAFVVELAQALARRGSPNGDPEERRFAITLLGRGRVELDPAIEPLRAVHQHPIRALDRDTPWVNRLYGATRLGRKVLDTLFLDPLHLEWGTASLAALPHLLGRSAGRGGDGRRPRYDVLVMEGGLGGALLARLLRRLLGLPFVDIAHGNSPRWEGAFARWGRPDRVVAFTEDTAEMVRRRAPGTVVEVIPHGIDLDLFRPDGPREPLDLTPPVVAVAGAVDANKRTALALAAVEHLAATTGRGSLLVLGDGPEAAALDRRGERLSAMGPGGPRYRRLRVPRDEMPRWYRAAQVFTMPSLYESFGLTYLEAMACGLPAVAPDDPVRREVLGGAGTFVDPTDAAAYARALTAALEPSPEVAAAKARERAEGFPFRATADAYAALFAEVAR